MLNLNLSTPSSEIKSKYPFITNAKELLASTFPPVEWLIHDILPLGGTAILGGPPKIGKSYFLLDIIKKITNTGSKVFYFAGEDNGRRLQGRILNLGIKDENLLLHCGRDHPINSNLYYNTLVEIIDEYPDIKAIFLDTMSIVLPTKSERSYDDWVNDLKPYNELAMRKNVTILMVHHTRKAKTTDEGWDEFLGSQGIAASFDTLMKLKRVAGENDAVTFKVGGKDIDDNEVRLEKKEFGYEIIGPEEVASLGATQHQVYAFICNNEGCTWSDIKTELNIDGGNLSTILKKLEASGIIERQDSRYYRMK